MILDQNLSDDPAVWTGSTAALFYQEVLEFKFPTRTRTSVFLFTLLELILSPFRIIMFDERINGIHEFNS